MQCFRATHASYVPGFCYSLPAANYGRSPVSLSSQRHFCCTFDFVSQYSFSASSRLHTHYWLLYFESFPSRYFITRFHTNISPFRQYTLGAYYIHYLLYYAFAFILTSLISLYHSHFRRLSHCWFSLPMHNIIFICLPASRPISTISLLLAELRLGFISYQYAL
jgi:hypothetical protein